MENLFKLAGCEYKDMPQNSSMEISDKNIKIKSYNHENGVIEHNLVTHIVRKQDAAVWEIVNAVGDVFLRCTENHKVFSVDKKSYVAVCDLVNEERIMIESLGYVHVFVRKTNATSPILDIQVEKVENYFSNGMLSHNTTSGGQALKFFASMRIDIRRKEQHKGPGDVILGNHLNAKIIKNKLAPPFRQAEYDFYFDTGFDHEGSALKPGIECGVIERTGTWFSFEGEKVANGSKNFGPYMREHPDVYARLITAINSSQPKEIPSSANFNEESGELE